MVLAPYFCECETGLITGNPLTASAQEIPQLPGTEPGQRGALFVTEGKTRPFKAAGTELCQQKALFLECAGRETDDLQNAGIASSH